MNFFRTWILPPLVGPLIGYFTNWLAIKMLFRPLKPVYLGKLKLPFTPGILPRERLRLSESVGETVSRELLTADVFRERLSEEALVLKMEDSIQVVLEGLLSGQASVLIRSVSDSAGEGMVLSDSEAGTLAVGMMKTVLAPGEFKESLSQAVRSTARELSSVPLREILPAEQFSLLVGEAVKAMADDSNLDSMDIIVDRMAASISLPAGSLVSGEALAPLARVTARSVYRGILPAVETLLKSEAVSSEFAGLAMKVVRKAIGRLNTIQRLIVGVANYEKTLKETMPDTIADVSAELVVILKEPGTADKIVESLVAYSRSRMEPSVPKAITGVSPEGYAWVMEERSEAEGAAGAAEPGVAGSSAANGAAATGDAATGDADLKIAGLFDTRELKGALREFFTGLEGDREGFVARAEARYRIHAEKPLGEALPGMTEALAGIVGGLLERKDGDPGWGKPILSQGMSMFLDAYALRLEGRTVAEVLGFDGPALAKISGIIARAVAAALSSQAERLVAALDIQTMVVDKLNELEMADVEKLILKVVKNELSWITFIGGVLGALIGLVQSLLTLI